MHDNEKILFCRCRYSDIIADSVKAHIQNVLSNSGLEFETVDDLCGAAAETPLTLRELSKDGTVEVFACFPRAVTSLFKYAGARTDNLKVYNMRRGSAQDILSEAFGSMELPAVSANQSQANEKPEPAAEWIPWYPVIDPDRCVNCKQCMDFCLFGVYGLSDSGHVEVKHPSSCKTNCPACARVCPQKAIIFPKYHDPPVNGDEAEAGSEQVSPRIEGKRIYELLKQKRGGAERFAGNKPGLGDIKSKLDIPPEVLSSLSAEEIKRCKELLEGKK
jgi:NAD-dependent dihydropyrimidine dehydrogenase PreA subunit